MGQAEVQITVLVDDISGQDELPGEHGFSCWIKSGKNVLLFDTGKSDLFLKNAAKLRIDPSVTTSVVLSHGHYDHTGGLKSLLGRNIDLKVYACSDAFNPKYARDSDGTIRYIGAPIAKADVEKRAKIILLNGPMQIMDSIYATGPVPRLTAFENTGGNFFTDADCTTTDMLTDDQSIFWETSKGIVILSGCAHSGIINTLNYVYQITGNKPIYAVIGGMHLLHADSERLQATLQAFKDYDVKIVIPVHCTGINAVEHFKNKIPECLKSMHTGSSILFS